MTKKSIQKHKQLNQLQSQQGYFTHEFANEPLSESFKQNNKKKKKINKNRGITKVSSLFLW